MLKNEERIAVHLFRLHEADSSQSHQSFFCNPESIAYKLSLYPRRYSQGYCTDQQNALSGSRGCGMELPFLSEEELLHFLLHIQPEQEAHL